MLKYIIKNDEIYKLLSLVTLDKPLFITHCISTILSASISLLYPLALEDITNLSTHADLAPLTILNSVLFWTVIYSAGAILSNIRRTRSERLHLQISLRLKSAFFKELLHKRFSAFTDTHTGSLTQQLNRDIDEISNILTTEASAAVRGLAFLLGGLSFILLYCTSLAMFTLLPMTIIALVGSHYGKILKRERSALVAISRESSSFTQEKIMQIKTVKLFNAENLELRTYEEYLRKIKEKSLVVSEYSARFYAIMEFLGENTVIWGLGFGIFLMKTNPELTIGKLTAFATYGVYVGMGFRLIVSGRTELSKALGLYSQIDRTQSDTTDREEVMETTAKPLRHKEGISIEVQAISYKYPGRDVLAISDISLKVGAGEICGIVGQSGSGKSTLFHLLTNLYSPDSGVILMNNTNVHTQPAWWVRSFTSIVSQEALLFSATILENISYSWPDATLDDIEEACKRADALEFINDLPQKFNTQVGENGFSLSGGQRQRISIARALLKDPQLLLLDEATSGLDHSSEALIQSIIEREVNKRGFTVIIITHRINTLKNLVDFVALMKIGRITEVGSWDEISMSKDFISLSKIE